MNHTELRQTVADVLARTPVIDMHTHLFPPSFGPIGLWGIDELVTYHYLEAELFRSADITPEAYWRLPKSGRADAIWEALFVRHAPISEATRGVVAVLSALGLPTSAPDLREARAFFAAQRIEDHSGRVMDLAGVSDVVMTNDPLEPDEAPAWLRGARPEARYHAVLRLDRVLNKWPDNWQTMAAQGYQVEEDAGGETVAEVRRFLDDWIARMRPRYMAVSLPDTFRFPEDSLRDRFLRHAVLPAGRDHRLPLSLMIGVRYQVNPALRLAGDAVGRADLRALEHLCREFPDNRFLSSVLSRENQHELVVYARKFSNLMPFGCWWFLNNPSIVEEITRERIEMLGASFIPQHSDARVLEQLIYKWRNTRRTLTDILANTYSLLAEDGRPVSRADVETDLRRMFRDNFERWCPVR